MSKRRKYSSEFKRGAVEQARPSRTPAAPTAQQRWGMATPWGWIISLPDAPRS